MRPNPGAGPGLAQAAIFPRDRALVGEPAPFELFRWSRGPPAGKKAGMLLRAPLLFAPLAALAGGLFFAACSSNGAVPAGVDSGAAEESDAGDAACQAFVPPTSFNPSSPAVTFSGDVLPIFSASCAFSSCHGAATGPQGGLYLGTDRARVYANLVAVSTEYPTMPRVDPGNPGNSFLLHRIDNDACALAGCTTTECSELMPQGGPVLAEAKLLTIRAWIAQGALSDLPDAGELDAGAVGTKDGGALDGSADEAAAPPPDGAPPGDAGDSGHE
jgi:hypothetical protein